MREGVHANVVLSVRPTGSPASALRWRARSLLKAALPAKLRRRLRRAEAAQRAARLPAAADSGALDCVLVPLPGGGIVCAPPGVDLQPAAAVRESASGAVLAAQVRYGQDLPRLAAGGGPVWRWNPTPICAAMRG